MRKLLFDLQEFIDVLDTLKEDGTTEILISEYNGYPTIADAADPDTVLILKPANDDEVKLPRGQGNDDLH